MAEGVTTPDGVKVDLNREFSAAMAAPEPDEPFAPAPPVSRKTLRTAERLTARPVLAQQALDAVTKHRETRTSLLPPLQPKQVTETPQAASQRRTEGVQGLMQIGAGLCLAVGKAKKNDAFKADAYVLASNAEPMADACASVAAENAAFANALDKITQVGPYGALVAIAVPMVTQMIRNHKPKANLPGTKDPKELAAKLEAPADEMPQAA